MKWLACCLVVLASLTLTANVCVCGESHVFPIGLTALDNIWDFEAGSPFDLSPEALVDLRSKGIEVVNLNGIYDLAHPGHQGRILFDWVMEDIDTLEKKLARADSFGFLVYAGVRTFEDALRRWGHDPIGNPDSVYFRWYGSERYTEIMFRDTLDSIVSWVVDSLESRIARNDTRSLYRYFFWDEPFAHHLKFYQNKDNTWDDHWLNIWEHDDTTGLDTDSLSVGSLLKKKIEEKDTLQSVWFNLCGYYSARKNDITKKNLHNAPRGLCALQADGTSNPPHQFSFDKFVFLYSSTIGDSSRVEEHWCTTIDSIVAPAKEVNPSNPPPVYVIQLQSHGDCRLAPTAELRITIPEEFRMLANLAVLHEVKGVMHAVLKSFKEGAWYRGHLWDDHFIPFDAPYEQYVYDRDSSFFWDPETLRPFNPDDPIHDPFRTLPPQPVDTPNYHKYLEDYNQWKYAPYARNYNALGEVNNQLHIIGTELLDLWKAPSVAMIEADSGNILLPEIVTFSPTTTSDVYLFFVNKDMKHSQMRFKVTIMRNALSGPLQSAYILDLSERHLIQRTVDSVYITFYATLGAGEGKLVKLVHGNEGADAMIADPDVEFLLKSGGSASTSPQYEFTEGDTIQLSATVYNLGFTPMRNLIVDFYYYHTDSLAGADTVTLPALSVSDTLPAKVRASFDWITKDSLISPHDMHVVLGPPDDATSDGANNNEANMTLLIHPADYATEILGDPWDMTERISISPGQLSTADIDSVKNLTETSDSISGVWEGRTTPDTVTGEPNIYLHVGGSINGSKYNQFSVRFLQDPDMTGQGYLKVGWLTTAGTPYADSVLYDFGHWNIKEFDFSGKVGWTGNFIRSLWIRPAPMSERRIKVAWTKLTTKKP